ncbi:induced myeloid leukemia cell differentiation protein Mcl-1 [Rhineura floridana]|uniref:induced myeloid leukemia cell differentiation protein Mcl-1 n=1 Tax=Rhineura floridana TaxID=261503 RepID=UPI002AC82557|nr:induced myeloid leukemia cell differentiation protein Mcl-1 [Rhineura floridana]
MFNRKTVVLYCGGAPSMAPAAPVSPGAGGGGGIGTSSNSAAASAVPVFTANRHSEAAGLFSTRIGGRPWGPNGFPEGPRALIGGGAPRAGPLALIGPFEGSPRALVGCPQFAAARPSALALPEGEIDGCESDAEEEGCGGDAAALPSPSPSMESTPSSSQGEEPESAAEEEEGESGGSSPGHGDGDDLRKVTLELVRRYLRETALAEGDAKEGPGGGKKLLQGLMSRFGTTHGQEAALSPCAAQALEILRRVGDGILDKHQIAFQGMLRKMEIKKEDDLKTVSEVATHVFSDGVTNWGRIVTLISFGAFVAKHLKSINQENGINTLAEIITDVLVTDKREWLLTHNAWEGFVKFFHVEDIEGSIRNVLMAFAGFAGLGASLAYMIR